MKMMIKIANYMRTFSQNGKLKETTDYQFETTLKVATNDENRFWHHHSVKPNLDLASKAKKSLLSEDFEDLKEEGHGNCGYLGTFNAQQWRPLHDLVLLKWPQKSRQKTTEQQTANFLFHSATSFHSAASLTSHQQFFFSLGRQFFTQPTVFPLRFFIWPPV